MQENDNYLTLDMLNLRDKVTIIVLRLEENIPNKLNKVENRTLQALTLFLFGLLY